MQKRFCEDVPSISIGDLQRNDLLNGNKTGLIFLNQDIEYRFILKAYMHEEPVFVAYDKHGIVHNIQLEKQPVYLGGKRYWFLCPYRKHGNECRNRAYTLYFDEQGFGCRECHGLVYRSQYVSHSSRENIWYQLRRYMSLTDKYFNLRTKWFKGRPAKRHQRYAEKQHKINAILDDFQD